jgi:membrane associated rhomboid family serine protease
MATGDEVVSPPTEDETPLPIQVCGMALPRAIPTPASVLQWIAEAGGKPWFPSQHATATGIERDSLDDPLAQLRLAGLVRIATWVRGLGQGYLLTPEGEQALAAGEGIPAANELTAPTITSSQSASEKSEPAPEFHLEDIPSHLGLDFRQPLVVAILLIANLLWFFVGMVVALRAGIPIGKFLSEGNSDILLRVGGITGTDLLHGEWWRLFSSCFVHAHGLHILMNLAALALIGPLAELLWGRVRLVIIYTISGLAGSCLAMALSPDSLLVGASGAIWGVMMAALAWFMLYRDELPPEIAADSIRRLVLAIILNAGLSFLPGISWEGHLGGAVAGFVTAGLLNTIRVGKPRARLLAVVLLVALPGVCVGGLIASMKWSDSWVPIRQQEASYAFNRDTAPLVTRLHSSFVHPVEHRARLALLVAGNHRKESLVQTRADVEELIATAKTALAQLSTPPLGLKDIDEHRGRTKEFVEARLHSLELLLGMLDSPAIPDEATLTKWNESCRTAENLWQAIKRQ